MRKPSVALIVFATLIAGCASPARYPSLAIRDAERVTGTMQPGPEEPYVPPATPAETLDLIAKLSADAAASHRKFVSLADNGRSAIIAGRLAAAGSEAWARAQVAIADLHASRSQTMIALAELDRLHIDAQLAAEELDKIGAARESVEAMVESETQTIESLQGGA